MRNINQALTQICVAVIRAKVMFGTEWNYWSPKLWPSAIDGSVWLGCASACR